MHMLCVGFICACTSSANHEILLVSLKTTTCVGTEEEGGTNWFAHCEVAQEGELYWLAS